MRSDTMLRWICDEPAAIVSESDWSAASERVSRRLGSAADKFDESLTREKGRKQDLDDLFRKANEKLGRKDGE